MVLTSVVVLVCSIIYLAPVDPTRLTFGQRSDNQTVARKRQELGLDKPLYIQLTKYLVDVSPAYIGTSDRYDDFKWVGLKLGSFRIFLKSPNFRFSYQTGREVSELLKDAIPKTIILALVAFSFASMIGILLGIYSAVKMGTAIDQFIIGITTIGISVPSYVSAIFFALLFGFVLRDLTGLNLQGSIYEFNDYGDEVVLWKNLLLPALALGIRPVAVITQISRSSLLDVLNQPYIQTAKAKGLSFTSILKKHALQNAMNPILTSLTGWLASLLAGAYFVEKVFNFKGVGELTINALINYDTPVILASMIFVCTVFIVINIITDILYTLIDPSIRKTKS